MGATIRCYPDYNPDTNKLELTESKDEFTLAWDVAGFMYGTIFYPTLLLVSLAFEVYHGISYVLQGRKITSHQQKLDAIANMPEDELKALKDKRLDKLAARVASYQPLFRNAVGELEQFYTDKNNFIKAQQPAIIKHFIDYGLDNTTSDSKLKELLTDNEAVLTALIMVKTYGIGQKEIAVHAYSLDDNLSDDDVKKIIYQHFTGNAEEGLDSISPDERAKCIQNFTHHAANLIIHVALNDTTEAGDKVRETLARWSYPILAEAVAEVPPEAAAAESEAGAAPVAVAADEKAEGDGAPEVEGEAAAAAVAEDPFDEMEAAKALHTAYKKLSQLPEMNPIDTHEMKFVVKAIQVFDDLFRARKESEEYANKTSDEVRDIFAARYQLGIVRNQITQVIIGHSMIHIAKKLIPLVGFIWQSHALDTTEKYFPGAPVRRLDPIADTAEEPAADAAASEAAASDEPAAIGEEPKAAEEEATEEVTEREAQPVVPNLIDQYNESAKYEWMKRYHPIKMNI